MILQRDKVGNRNNLNKPNGVSHLHLRALLCLIALLAILSSTAQAKPFAEQAKRFEDGVTWTKNITVTKKAISVEDYCADSDTTCKTKVHSPDQVGMNSAQINSKKTSTYFNNKQATAVQDSFDKGRPKINPNDETYRMALIGQDNAYEISHGISNAYVDCESGMTCTASKSLQHCSMPTNNPITCEKVPYVISGNATTGVSSIGQKGVIIGVKKPLIFTVPTNVSAVSQLTIPEIRHWTTSDTLNFYLNGVFVAQRATNRKGGGGFQHSRIPAQTIAINEDIPTTGTIELSFGGMIVWAQDRMTLTWQQGENIMGWKSTCNGILPVCKKTTEVCTEAGGTRRINGINTTLDCWKYELTYLCETVDTCLKNRPIKSRTCKAKIMGVCIEYDAVQEIQQKSCKESALICGETSFCLEGDCYEETQTQSQDFSKAASMLAAASKAAEDITDPPLIFKGKNQQCSIKIGGIANCCKDGGWGTDINVTSCSSEEKALGAAQNEQLTIPLGSYCAEKILGACIRKKRSYCVFDSKLARIIQEQGRPQIGRGFGSAKSPDCSAITPEEMQQMDFSKIDFKDFYGDMQNNTNLPNMDEIKARIQSAHGS